MGIFNERKPNKDIANDELIASILDANEDRANRLAVVVFSATLLVEVINIVLNAMGIYKIGQFVNPVTNIIPITVCILPIVARLGHKLDSTTLKWLNIVCAVVIVAWAEYVLGYNAPLFMAMPIIFGAMYFSERTTIITFVLTAVGFAFSTFLAASGNGLLDNNHVQVPDGTVLKIQDGLKQTLLDYGLRNEEYITSSIYRGYIPKLLGAGLVLILAIAVTRFGYDMILKQAAITKERTRIETELQVAGQLQSNALPLVSLLNGKYNYELAAGMTAARECGGDFYDFTMIDDEHLAMVIADVSDKGVPAALFMMSAKEKLHSAFVSDRRPGEILQEVNNSLCENNERNMFVTVWLGILNIKSGKLVSANGGHEYPIVQKAGGRFEEIHDEHGIVLGVFENMKFPEHELQMEAGDILVQYTDGVTEARSESGELYGMDRLVEGLNEAFNGKNVSADEIQEELKQQLKEFVGAAEPSDDITTLILKFM